MRKNYYDIIISLAGICQASSLVQSLAYNGNCDNGAYRTMLKSILDLSPKSTLSVFDSNESNLQIGLETLISLLNITNRQSLNTELMRYSLNLMVLERKLSRNKQACFNLAQRISFLDRQLVHYDVESDTLIRSIASIYIDVISPLGPRIQITGLPNLLKNSQLQSKVRAILLAGIRSAVLWQQVGGGRMQLLFSRQRLLYEAKNVLSSLDLKSCLK